VNAETYGIAIITTVVYSSTIQVLITQRMSSRLKSAFLSLMQSAE